MPGPNLAGLVGRPVGGDPGFGYSPARRATRAEGMFLGRDRLERFLAEPEAMVPGTGMSCPGIRDPGERAALAALIAAHP